VTVWNRSQQKVSAHVARGAKGAATVSNAVQASPVIMICVDNYSATNASGPFRLHNHSVQYSQGGARQ
jgi:3-hydroxyisobutyrate dehydrogenase-like beta-hydroxyacid dehydrogenase